jgi:hypothetical protein
MDGPADNSTSPEKQSYEWPCVALISLQRDYMLDTCKNMGEQRAMQLLWLFIGNVFAHWVALLSGLASVSVAIWETIKKKTVSPKVFWTVALICLFVSCDQAWQDEHRNTQVVEDQKASLAGELEGCKTSAKIENAAKRALETFGLSSRETIDRQQRMSDRQSNDISRCLILLEKMNPRITEEIRVVPIVFEARDVATHRPLTNLTVAGHNVEYTFMVLITTNQNEPRLHGLLDCSSPFEVASIPQLSVLSATDPNPSFSKIQAVKKKLAFL